MSKIDLYKGECLEVMDELIANSATVNKIIDSPCFPIDMELKYDTKEIISEKDRNVAMDFFSDFMQMD